MGLFSLLLLGIVNVNFYTQISYTDCKMGSTCVYLWIIPIILTFNSDSISFRIIQYLGIDMGIHYSHLDTPSRNSFYHNSQDVYNVDSNNISHGTNNRKFRTSTNSWYE